MTNFVAAPWAQGPFNPVTGAVWTVEYEPQSTGRKYFLGSDGTQKEYTRAEVQCGFNSRGKPRFELVETSRDCEIPEDILSQLRECLVKALEPKPEVAFDNDGNVVGDDE